MSQTVWALWEQGDLVGIWSRETDAELEAESRRASLQAETGLPDSAVEVVACVLRQSSSANDTADDEDSSYLPWTTLTLDDARKSLSAWHFSKESLSREEQQILYVAEALLRHIDQRDAQPHDQ